MGGPHFTYKEQIVARDLAQGDILVRTPELEEVLKAFYPSYANNANNKYFIVLTQSCELVRRDGDPCDARYIALAPVRPLSVALGRKLSEHAEAGLDAELPICTEKSRNKLNLWLERLLNNNEPEYFYLRKAPESGLAEDCCAHLALAFAIKSELRYQLCLDARILALKEPFQAKLGWLVGQMFSRIGTEDWNRSEMSREIRLALEGTAIWVPDKKLAPLRKLVAEWLAANPGAALNDGEIEKLLSKVPRRKDQVVERVVSLLKDKGMFPDAKDAVRARNLIASDAQLSKLLSD